MGAFRSGSVLWVAVAASLGMYACSEDGSQSKNTVDDKECYISYKKVAVAIDMEFVECCSDIDNEEELDRCIEQADDRGDENFHDFKDCPSSGSCLDKCQDCLGECDRSDEDCSEHCFSEMETCSLWYDTGCIEGCALTRDKCWNDEVNGAFDFSKIDWDTLQNCLIQFDKCSDDCIA